MSEQESARVIVGPTSERAQILDRVRQLGADPNAVSIITVGLIRKTIITDWVGVAPPEGDVDLWVNLVAPDMEGREPTTEWAYTHGGRWSWSPDGASSCFNHADLMAVKAHRNAPPPSGLTR